MASPLPPLEDVSITCRQFKCFSDALCGFEKIKPLNVIIGRNNSGKSTLLDLIDFATRPSPELLDDRRHRGQPPQVFLSWSLTEQYLDGTIEPARQDLRTPEFSWSLYPRSWANEHLLNKRALYELRNDTIVQFVAAHIDLDIVTNARHRTDHQWIVNRLGHHAKNPFKPFEFRRILADRDIVTEPSSDELEIQPNGDGLTNVIQRYITAGWLDRDVVENLLLVELNSIFFPDAHYDRILVQQHKESGKWEIYLDEKKKGRIPMSHTGSGCKTVLFVLANLLLLPRLKRKKPKPLSEFIFGFEELENNLHPAIQRRLFRYLCDRAIKDGCRFCITTHSNVVIDLFDGDKHAQILHVTHDGQCASVQVVGTSRQGYTVLDDLDVRASDLLQTNAVVWVEGPSDRYYFNRWIELWTEGTLVEGVHYQCLPFGGSSNAHLAFDWPEVVDELIPALKINRDAILLIDSDKRSDEDELKLHTKRLVDEMPEEGYAWVTAGKEVENYIPASAFKNLLKNEALKGPEKFTNVIKYLSTQEKIAERPKTEVARKILPLLTKEALADVLDMETQLDHVCSLIRKWNRIE